MQSLLQLQGFLFFVYVLYQKSLSGKSKVLCVHGDCIGCRPELAVPGKLTVLFFPVSRDFCSVKVNKRRPRAANIQANSCIGLYPAWCVWKKWLWLWPSLYWTGKAISGCWFWIYFQNHFGHAYCHLIYLQFKLYLTDKTIFERWKYDLMYVFHLWPSLYDLTSHGSHITQMPIWKDFVDDVFPQYFQWTFYWVAEAQ